MGRKPRQDDKNLQEGEPQSSEVLGADEPETEYELESGQVVDLITGEGVKLTDLEQIRQEEERKLLEEFGYPAAQRRDLIRLNFRVQPRQLKARRLPLAILRPGKEMPDEERAYILVDIHRPKTKAEDSEEGC
ncbi:MAG: hypothetical protein IPG28_17860 [Betaproteobacteria bacterium]|nr:hypothetical protein [Betaproteobacteria bacterium]